MSQTPTELGQESTSYFQNRDKLEEMILHGWSLSGREPNCCFLNTESGRFVNVSGVSGFDFADDARSLAMVDWDHDGDLDVWVTNRTAPRVRFLRNDAAGRNHFLAIRLEGQSCNRDAIGARLELYSSDGKVQLRTLRAGEGFLGQSSKWQYFGLGTEGEIERLVVRWPGGEPEVYDDLTADQWYLLTQGSGVPQEWVPPARNLEIAATPAEQPAATSRASVRLSWRIPLPALEYEQFDGSTTTISSEFYGTPVLVNLWATWCPSCIAELSDLSHRHEELEAAGLKILALSADGLSDESGNPSETAREFLERYEIPFAAGMATNDLQEILQVVLAVRFLPRALPVPTSLLLDSEGRLAAVYYGAVSAETILADVQTLGLNGDELFDASLPFEGRWVTRPETRPSLVQMVHGLLQLGYLDEMLEYVELNRAILRRDPQYPELLAKLGATLYDEGRLDESASYCRRAIELDANLADAYSNLGVVELRRENTHLALEYMRRAVAIDPSNLQAQMNLGTVLMNSGELEDAVATLRQAVQLAPGYYLTYLKLATALEMKGDTARAAEAYRLAAELMIAEEGDSQRILEAVAHAARADQLQQGNDPRVLTTLADAHAAAGEYEAALGAARLALNLASQQNLDELETYLRQRIPQLEQQSP